MTADETPRAVAADPEMQSAVIQTMRGNLQRLSLLDAGRLRVAVRSVSILVAGRVAGTHPCDLGPVTFFQDAGALTFLPRSGADMDPANLAIARMVAVDASAFLAGDHGDSTHALWLSLWEAVPASERRRLAFILGKTFTANPQPAQHPGDHRADS